VSDIRAITYDDQVPTTFSDTTDDPNGPFAAMYVDSSGVQITYLNLRGRQLTLFAPQGGTIYPFGFKRILNTGTTSGAKVLGLYAIGVGGRGGGP
jgi:pectin methylesterase-like acyl-CoA thioesterase